jgi:hypothetical protein
MWTVGFGRKRLAVVLTLTIKSTAIMKIIIVLFIVTLSCGVQPAFAFNGAQDNACGACELRFKMPDGWVSESPSSRMRGAQYTLPKADGDAEDASLVVYYFGPS